MLASLGLASCGGGKNPDLEAAKQIPVDQQVGNQKAEILEGSETLSFQDGVLKGSGSVRFSSVLEATDSANNFTIKLVLEPSQSVVLIANSDRNLASGVEIDISRVEGKTGPKIEIRAGEGRAGDDKLDISRFFETVDVSKEMVLSFDIHNDHGDSLHVVAWKGIPKLGEEVVEDIIRGRGFGPNWGLKLKGARVSSIEKNVPQKPHNE